MKVHFSINGIRLFANVKSIEPLDLDYVLRYENGKDATERLDAMTDLEKQKLDAFLVNVLRR